LVTLYLIWLHTNNCKFPKQVVIDNFEVDQGRWNAQGSYSAIMTTTQDKLTKLFLFVYKISLR
jgi:hypothetical protein